MLNLKNKRNEYNLPVGEGHHCAQLTEEKVIELRRLVNEVGTCYKCAGKIVCPTVSCRAVWDAVNFVTWKHV